MLTSLDSWLAGRVPLRWGGLVSLIGLPALVHASAPSDSTRWKMPWHRHFSVGLQAVRFPVSNSSQALPNGEQAVFQGVFPTLGGQLTPRWRVGMGAWWHHTTTPETTKTDANGNSYRSASTSAGFALPLRAGFSLFPNLAHWRVEALGGVVLLYTQTDTQFAYTSAGQPLRPLASAGNEEQDDLLLLLGVGTTYTLTPHWSVCAAATANWSPLGSLFRSAFGDKSFPWQPGYEGGVQYNFAFPRRHRQ